MSTPEKLTFGTTDSIEEPPVYTRAELLGEYADFWGEPDSAGTAEANEHQIPHGLGVTATGQTVQITELTLPTATPAETTELLGEYADFWGEPEESNPHQGGQPIDSEQQNAPAPSQTRTDWNAAALEGQGYDREEGRWPSSKREWNRSRRAYREKDHLGTLRATLTSIESGVYSIHPESGASTWRDENGKLHGYDRKTRGSIRRQERIYAALRNEFEHGQHKLEGHGRNGLMPTVVKAGKAIGRGAQAAARFAQRNNEFPNGVSRVDQTQELPEDASPAPARNYPPRPSKHAAGNDRATRKPARTERGRKWQEQQEINRNGVK